MLQSNLVEIRKGQTGNGLLIEKDGFISLDASKDATLKEAIERMDSDDFQCPYPLIFPAVFQKFGIENANGRIYPENVLKREVEKYQTRINERRALAELNHPSDSIIDLSRVALNVRNLYWDKQTLRGEIEIITSPGFRKYGMISCQGDQAANLLLSGYKIGLSSRGVGSVVKKYGALYVADDYELVCFDIVSEPSTPGAWIGDSKESLEQYVESVQNGKSVLDERLMKFNDWLKA